MNIQNPKVTDLHEMYAAAISVNNDITCNVPETVRQKIISNNVAISDKTDCGKKADFKISIITNKSESNHIDEIAILKQKLAIIEKDLFAKDAEIERLTEKLHLVKSNMDQFSYVASHDLKEPLRMVTSYLGLLKNKFGGQLDDKANTYIDFAINGGAKLHTMFNGLLDLSQTGRVDEQKKEIDFKLLMEDVQINLSKKIKESKAQIKICSALPVLPVFEKSITRLFENLICNAIKFSNADELPVVEISATEKKTVWEFCISDNGIGMEAGHFEQIFAVFSKLHTAIVYPGSGIGLAICKKAVEHHGGLIWVKAEINKGSEFYFTLPK